MMPNCMRLRTPARLRRLLLRTAGERGAEIFEFAMVAPLLLTLLLGIIWMARAYNIYQTITRAAREGARTAAVNTCTLCGNAIATNSSVRTAVTTSLSASNLDPAKVTNAFSGTCPSGQSCDCPSSDICIIRDVPLNAAASPELGVVVSFGYPVDFPIPFVNLASITVSTSVQMREER